MISPRADDRPTAPRLGGPELASLRATAESVDYPAGAIIFEYGDEAEAFYLVESGRVECYVRTRTGRDCHLEFVGEGRVLGEVGYLFGGRRTATAKALYPSTLLRLGFESVAALIAENPAVAQFLMESMADRLRRSGTQLRDIAIDDPDLVAIGERSPADRRMIGVARFLGTRLFLLIFGLSLSAWLAAHALLGLDPAAVALALTLSTVQIVIGNLVLNSQTRAAIHDEAIGWIEFRANIRADDSIAELHRREEANRADLLARLETIEARLPAGSPP